MQPSGRKHRPKWPSFTFATRCSVLVPHHPRPPNSQCRSTERPYAKAVAATLTSP
ncbi:hypothetical protein K443DRAFT_658173 [Laccaria amethystina LaAM-08-1]|uniref:Uncharacterized protein n=1 Tax=Laccaria amethystina LaAM-08-1 TaxID=1095629 RepID=A0A0C9WH70_9AGAR|nr:hypothetical protein K443DRAFT_658173 [Laccaria amethystina LaAM-08-1]